MVPGELGPLFSSLDDCLSIFFTPQSEMIVPQHLFDFRAWYLNVRYSGSDYTHVHTCIRPYIHTQGERT